MSLMIVTMVQTLASWYVYLVKCGDGSLYCGITTNIERRLKEHNSGSKGAKYTRSRRPVSLVHVEPSENRSTASRREAQIKKLTRKQKEELIK